MSPEERAKQLVRTSAHPIAYDTIAAAIRTAVAEEREACKLIAAKRWVVGRNAIALMIADEIEARSQEATP
jgi:hypothetical protein